MENYGTSQQLQSNVKEQVSFQWSADVSYNLRVQDASQNGTLQLPSIVDNGTKTLDVNDSIIGVSRLADDSITNAKLQSISENNFVAPNCLDISSATVEVALDDGDYFLIADTSNVKKKVSFATIASAIDDHAIVFSDNTIPPETIENQTAQHILQANSSGVMTSRAISGDITITDGVSAIGADKVVSSMIASNAITATEIGLNAITSVKIINDAITSAKIADQSNITFANLGTTIYKGTGNYRWKVVVSNTEYKVQYSTDAISYNTLWNITAP